MMKKQFLALVIIFFCGYTNAQLPINVLASIPAELKKDAHSVVREKTIVFAIRSIDKAYYKVHEIITVLDAVDEDELDFNMTTDKFRSLEDVSVMIYSSVGEKLMGYNKKEMTALNNIGEGLVSDGKIYYKNGPGVSSYPVHLVRDYEIKFSGLIVYPSYEVQSVGQSVEKSSFTTIVPVELDIRYKERNITLTPAVLTEKGNKIYTWETKNMPALHYEPGSVNRESRYPAILIAPNKFKIDEYEGDMTSWKNFGEWYNTLTKKTINLTTERKLFFNNLVKGTATDKEKATIIYKYLQENCRYVLITLGIGGLKPFEASFVDKKKYGDCKALTNYTQACLDAVGIKSYQALINAEYNNEPVDPSFPYMGFNHDILCIPFQKDSVWLECTSNTNEFGVLGSFTENRNALLITENGGQLVATPKSKAANNKFSTQCIINLNDDGSGFAKVTMQTTGEYKRHFITTEKKDDQKKYIVNDLGFIQPDDFLLTEKNKTGSELAIELDFEKIPSFTAGNKMFLSPQIYKIWNTNLPDTTNRTQDYYFQYPFIKDDSTFYHLPAGYTIEVLPVQKKISFEYGNFNTAYSYDKNKNEVLVITHLELTNYHIPSNGFGKTKTFFDAVLAEYNSKIVIMKSN